MKMLKSFQSRLLVSCGVLFLWSGLQAEETGKSPSYFLIGNSLTWDTVPSRLDGDVQWHVDCGKSLPWMFQNPEEPCVKTSTLWPTALAEKPFDWLSIQVHYGSTLAEDAATISELIALQPAAKVIVHTGWARFAERKEEWAIEDRSAEAPMKHHLAYFDALLELLKAAHPERSFARTQAMDLLQQVEEDIAAGKAPVADVSELYRDKVHMNVVTGRYLMHNAMRHALGQPRSVVGFERLDPVETADSVEKIEPVEKIDPEMKAYLDSVLDRVLGA